MNKDLPDGWKLIKLGDIAFEVLDRIDNPSKSGLERFVGLEHIDSESLTVKRWGSTDDVTSAMKLFKKGDMLFARRNAYLKRASMATFEGVCSGDAIVLRQKNEEYVNGLLPLILNMEKLWEFAIANASGSMSKRVKWRDLATFEIPLPPKEEQRNIADMLWAAEDCITKNVALFEKIKLYKEIFINEFFKCGIGYERFKKEYLEKTPKEWKIARLEEYASVRGRIGWRGLKASEYTESGPYLIANKHIVDDRINWTTCDHLSEYRYQESPEIQLQPNDIVFSKDGSIGQVAFIDYIPSKATINSTMMLIRVIEKNIIPKFLFYFLQSAHFKIFINQKVSGSAIPHIFQKDMKDFKILVPPLPEQQKIIEILSKVDDAMQKAKEDVTKIKTLKMRLLNHLLNDGMRTAYSIYPQAKELYQTQVRE